MPLNPEATKRRIFAAAVDEFATHGVAGARVDRIATNAKANKESIYRYYGTKDELLGRVLDQYLDERGHDMLPTSKDLDQYAADMIAFHRAHPEFLRLSLWEALESGSQLSSEHVAHRREHYQSKLESVTEMQSAGAIDPDIDPRFLLIVLYAMAGWWFVLPQSARMIMGEELDADDLDRFTEFVAESIRKIAAPARKKSAPKARR